ncbi:ABC transporter ATP-binding protein [Azorhizobium oxalatiphilum]|uniref:ABC transporter ATP-binding protein n=1 Tax=Azorhizobium oxalatiphilum TaxID=980631 RepID=A0A917C4L5_9HYPH|nr:ABC transporter ATP-binding protein [Azorhizobium oxalatiphilum]GGF69787.1 ABC transporter ATP-binding protein [Azorhizobium oxalatiphilum]
MLEVSNLSVSYGGPDVLSGVSLEVKAGETVAVLGANTAGKTTLLRTVSGLIPKARGNVVFENSPLLGRPAHSIPKLGIGHVPEGRHVFPRMSTMDNLMMGAYGDRRATDLGARVDRVLTLFPRLAERRTQMAGSMSGGEQQMVAIGRALMGNPKLLLLDEPSHGLAPIVVEELHRAIGEINRQGVSVLLVEQNAILALSVAHRGYVLEAGHVVLSGTSQSLKADPGVRRAYLGV